jgi:para-nitrobenzyl esterase
VIQLPLSGIKYLRTLARLDVGGQALRAAGGEVVGFTALSAPIDLQIIDRTSALRFRLEFEIAGSESLQFLPLGSTTNVTAQIAWPHPDFDGAFLPVSHQLRADGYTAHWQVFELNRAVLTSNAGGIVHPVIEPYLLPRSPYETFVSGRQNDVPLLLGSNAEEARAIVDVTQVMAATFSGDIARSFGPLPPPLMAAYPHATDEEARAARLDFERDLRFGWDMWAWARLQATTGHNPVYYYLFQLRPPFPKDSVYAGWGASHFAELWYVFDHLDQNSWRWTPADRTVAAEIATYWVNFARSGNPNGNGVPPWPAFENTEGKVQYLGDPITTDGVLGIDGLRVFDAVYVDVRGKPFATP